MYFKDGMVKVEIGVGKGKQQFDKRATIRKKEQDRELRRVMSRKGVSGSRETGMTKPQTRSWRTAPLVWVVLLSSFVVLPRAIWVRESHSESSDDEYHLVRGLEFLRGEPGLVHRELNDPPLGEAIAALRFG